MAAERLVHVHGLGLDERFRSMLDVFFARSCSGEYKLSNDAADLLLVDLDALGARDAYAEYRENNARLPSILFSLNEQEFKTRGNIVLLHKPFTVRQLQSAFQIISLRFLNRLPKEITERRAGNENGNAGASGDTRAAGRADEATFKKASIRSDIPVVTGQQEEGQGSAFRAAFSLASHKEYVKINTLLPGIAGKGDTEREYDPKQYLQSELVAAFRAAGEQNRNALIKVAGGTLTIDPDQALVKIGMGNFQMREVSSFPLNNSNFRLSLVQASEHPVIQDGKSTIISLRSLIWQTALYAGRGRVPRGTDMDAMLQMRRWPNLTRLLLTPGAARISAIWTTRPCSINSLAKQLGLSIHDVASFYSAAHAIELFYTEDRSMVKPEQNITRSKQDGLLGRILRRLRA